MQHFYFTHLVMRLEKTKKYKWHAKLQKNKGIPVDLTEYFS